MRIRFTPVHARRRVACLYLPVLLLAGFVFVARTAPVDGLGVLAYAVMMAAGVAGVADLFASDRRAR